ncbi:MAG: hypothetical protein U0893_14890 [Chloroflexota bacterium]
MRVSNGVASTLVAPGWTISILPRRSRMNVRPSGAKVMPVGSVRPTIGVVS